jgi:hypothetical protein
MTTPVQLAVLGVVLTVVLPLSTFATLSFRRLVAAPWLGIGRQRSLVADT